MTSATRRARRSSSRASATPAARANLSGANPLANQYHSVFIWDVGNTAYLVGVDNEELHDIDIFDISDPRNPQPVREYDAIDAVPGRVDRDGQRRQRLAPRRGRQADRRPLGDARLLLGHGLHASSTSTDPANATLIADTDFGGADPLTGFDPPEGNAHQAEFTNDNQYIVTRRGGLLGVPADRGRRRRRGDVRRCGGRRRRPARRPRGRASSTGRWPTAATAARIPLPAGSRRPGPECGGDLPGASAPPARSGSSCCSAARPCDTNEDYNGNGIDDDACFPGEKAARRQPPAGTRCCWSTAIPDRRRRVLRLRRATTIRS